MKYLSIFLILIAIAMMSCKSSEESSNGNDSAEHSEMTNEVDNTATESEKAASDFIDQTTQKKKMNTDELFGKWQWVQTSCCGRTSRDIFPEEGAEKRIISFDKDGNAEYFTGDEGKKLEKHTFTIGAMGTQSTIRIGDLQPAIFYVNENELSLSWGYMDLQIEYYQRVK